MNGDTDSITILKRLITPAVQKMIKSEQGYLTDELGEGLTCGPACKLKQCVTCASNSWDGGEMITSIYKFCSSGPKQYAYEYRIDCMNGTVFTGLSKERHKGISKAAIKSYCVKENTTYKKKLEAMLRKRRRIN